MFASSARCWGERLYRICFSCFAVIWALFVFSYGPSYAIISLKSMRFAWAIGQFLAQCSILLHLKQGALFPSVQHVLVCVFTAWISVDCPCIGVKPPLPLFQGYQALPMSIGTGRLFQLQGAFKELYWGFPP